MTQKAMAQPRPTASSFAPQEPRCHQRQANPYRQRGAPADDAFPGYLIDGFRFIDWH